MGIENSSWTTEAELSFLDGLKAGYPKGKSPADYMKTLKGYIKAKRVEWEDMDGKACVNHAKRLLAAAMVETI